MSNKLPPLALYVHWPFCASKCPYCDFNSHVSNNIDHELWAQSYIKELEYFAPELQKRQIKTLFFGGGTPSLMNPKIVETIINWLKNNTNLAPEIEITIEANPTSVETAKLEAFKAAGINRLSIGIQSFNNMALQKLGRTHSAQSGLYAIQAGAKIFDNYSFDMIYAREGQKLKDWKEELDYALNFAGQHLSLYQLTIEKGTAFYTAYNKGELILPEQDIAADMYLYTRDLLEQKGFVQYEISNFARPGFECKHNLCYWNYEEYLGIGPGAHSRICFENDLIPREIMQYSKPDKWINSISEIGNAMQINTQLTEKEIIEEILMMGLRLSIGITDDKLGKYLQKDFKQILNFPAIDKFMTNKYLEYDGKYLKLTNLGLLLHSYIVPRIII